MRELLKAFYCSKYSEERKKGREKEREEERERERGRECNRSKRFTVSHNREGEEM